MSTEQSTDDGGVGDLAARVANLEGVREREIAAKNYVPAPQASAFARSMAEQFERLRASRRRTAEVEAEKARLQAKREAPKRAKRDQEIAALDAQITKLHDQRNAIPDKIREVMLTRQALVGKPL